MPSCRVVLLACLAAAGLAALWAPCNLDTERLRGRRVVVCGASVGIGKEIALQYSAHGAEVLLVARRQGVLEEVAEECRKAGAKAVHVSAQDLSKAENCQAVIDDAAKYMGGIDTLILNHIVGFWGSWGAVEDPAATLDFYTRINFHSYVLLTTYALDMLEESRGSIAVISSLAGKMGLPRVAPYAATKHALHGFFDSFRHELAENGTDVSITSVFLGNIDTESNKKMTKGDTAHLSIYSKKDAASAVIAPTECRRRDAYFPYAELRPLLVLRTFFPDLVDSLVRLTVLQKWL